MAPDMGAILAQIRNDIYLIRHYRGGRTAIERARRKQAIQKLGLTLRFAFSVSDDFETILKEVLDGLRPIDRPPF
jgi:cytosine/adenosine deaminase-related metal-dependent hydrolase